MKSESQIAAALDGLRHCLRKQWERSAGKTDAAAHDAMISAMTLRWISEEIPVGHLETILFQLLDAMSKTVEELEEELNNG